MKFAQLLLNGAKSNIPKQVDRFSKFSPSPLSMKQFLDFGKYKTYIEQHVSLDSLIDTP